MSKTITPAEALTMTSTSAIKKSKMCPKCGTNNKSRQLSCCARGGAWFKKCGGTGDPQFDYSWVEGIQACKGLASSFPVNKAAAQARHEGVVVILINSTGLRNTDGKHINIHPTHNISSAVGNGSFKDRVDVDKLITFVFLLLIMDFCLVV